MAVSRTIIVGPLTLLRPDMVKATVEDWLDTVLRPVAFEKSMVAVVVAVIYAFSMFFIEEGVTELIRTA